MSSLRTFKKVDPIVIVDATNGWIEDVKIVVLRNIFQFYYFLAIRKEAFTTFLHEIRSHADIGVHLKVHV